jgi:hypothetical protein
MKRRIPLSKADPTGRVDVALYRLAGRLMERLEREQGVQGLREHILPLVEDLIRQNVPVENMLPQEIQALVKICELNRGVPRRRMRLYDFRP